MERLLELDGRLLLGLREMVVHPALDKAMIFVSSLGDKGMLWIAIGLLLLLFGIKKKNWRQRGLFVLFSLAANFLLCNLILKPLVDRTRPYVVWDYTPLIPPVGDASFPSGHTSASFAAATALYCIDKRWGIAAYILSVLIGFSRLYLGVHFPLDVFCGAILGAASAKLVQKLYWERRKTCVGGKD
ncbi:MAG: phosphatase PAP2 family protein [Bacillota bacterium]|nr:phosphatase PAP2 family protein [Bacillota bacterium]